MHSLVHSIHLHAVDPTLMSVYQVKVSFHTREVTISKNVQRSVDLYLILLLMMILYTCTAAVRNLSDKMERVS
jgi:hypothetical protein